jgi:hypothetical protein
MDNAELHGEFQRLRDDVNDLHSKLMTMSGDMRESYARIEGSLQTMAASKEGAQLSLEQAISTERHRGKNTEVVVNEFIRRMEQYPRPDELAKLAGHLDEYPTPHEMRETASLSLANAKKLDQMKHIAIGMTIGSSIGGASLVTLFSQVFGG